MILPLSIYGAHSILSDLYVLGNLYVHRNVTALDFTNSYGIMTINDLKSNVISISKNKGIADLSIRHDDTLQIVDGSLSVVPKILMQNDLEMKAQLPLQLSFDSDTEPSDPIGSTMKLLTDPSDFQVDDDDGRLQLVPETFKGLGCIKVQTSTDSDWSDFLLDDLDISIPKLRVFKLKTSDFFTQSNGTLSVANKPGGQIPFYSTQGGLDSDQSLKFDGASTLSVRYVKLDTSLQLPAEYATSKHYVSQYIQSEEGSAIDVLDEVQGANKRLVKLRFDASTFAVNNQNNLEIKQIYRAPLFLEKDANTSEIHLKYDDKSIKVNDSSELEFGLRGDGILVDLPTSLIKVNHDETLKIVNGQLSLNISTSDPIALSNGKDLSLNIDNTLQVTGDGKLAMNLLVDNQTISWTSDQKLKSLYNFRKGLILSDYNVIDATFQTCEYPLKVSSDGSLRLWFDDTLRIDPSGNLSVLPVLVDNYTIVRRNDATFRDGALKINLIASNGVSLAGNKLTGSYLAGNRISISNATIACNTQDLEDDIAKNTSDIANTASDLITQAAALGTAVAASAAAAATGIALANSAIAANAVTDGLVSGLTTGLAATDAAMSALSLQTSANSAGLASVTSGLSSGIAGLEAEIVGLTSAVTANTISIGTLSTATASNSTAIGLNSGLISGLTASTESQFAVLQTQTSTLFTLSSTNSSLIGGLQAELAVAEGTIAIHTGNLATIDGTLVSLGSGVAAASALASTAQATAVAAEASAAGAAGVASSAMGLSTSNSASIALIMLGLFGSSGGGRDTNLYDWTASIQNTVDALYLDHLVDGGTILTKEEASSLYLTTAAFNTTISLYPTITAMNAALATKESILTFNGPLTRTGSSISIDLSSYVQNSSLATTLTPYALRTEVTSMLSPYAVATSVYDKVTSDSRYLSTSSFNTSIANYTNTSGMNVAIAAAVATKESPLTFTAPLSRSVNNISIDLSSYALKANNYTKTESDGRFMPMYPGGMEIGEGLNNVNGNCVIDMHSSPGSDYDLRMYRQPGYNGHFSMENVGAGSIQINAANIILNGTNVNTFVTNATLAATLAGNVTIGSGLSINSPSSGDGYNGNILTLRSRVEPNAYNLYINGNVIGGATVGWSIGMVNNNANYPSMITFDRGNVLFPSATDSSSSTTGALQVAGGVGIAGTLNLGKYCIINSTTAAAFQINNGTFGYSQLATQWFVNTLATDYVIRAHQYNLRIGTNGSTSSNLDILTSGNVIINTTTDSTSTTTGALQVAGGLGVARSINTGKFMIVSASADNWLSSTPKCIFMRYSIASGQDSAYIQSVQHGVGYLPLGIECSSLNFNVQAGGAAVTRLQLTQGQTNMFDPVYISSGNLKLNNGVISFTNVSNPGGRVEADANHAIYLRQNASGVVDTTSLYAWNNIRLHTGNASPASQPLRMLIDVNGYVSMYNGLSVTGGNLNQNQNINDGSWVTINNQANGSNAFSIFSVQTYGAAAYLFLNSNSRTVDGGPTTLTLRNDNGATRIMAGNNLLNIQYNGDVGISSNLICPSVNCQYVNFNNGTNNCINFGTVGVAPPSYNSRSLGTKIVMFSQVSASACDYALGIDGGTLWSSVPSMGQKFSWYAGTTEIAKLDSSGLWTSNNFINICPQNIGGITGVQIYSAPGYGGYVSIIKMQNDIFSIKCGSAPNSFRASMNDNNGMVYMEAGLQVNTKCTLLTAVISGGTIGLNQNGSGGRYSVLEFWSGKSDNSRSGYICHNPGTDVMQYWNGDYTGLSVNRNTDGSISNITGGGHQFSGGVLFLDPVTISGAMPFTFTLQGNGGANQFGSASSNNWLTSGTYNMSLITKFGILTQSSFFAMSDAREKKNIRSLPEGYASDTLQRINAKLFNMISDGKPCLGFIAQDVEKFIPEAVLEANDRKVLDSMPLLAVLWQALKETLERVENMKDEIDNLKKILYYD